jgi:hypothetical protein
MFASSQAMNFVAQVFFAFFILDEIFSPSGPGLAFLCWGCWSLRQPTNADATGLIAEHIDTLHL